jgi:hypothetical protein
MALVQTLSHLRLVTADTLRPPPAAAGAFPLAHGQVHEFAGAVGMPPLTVMLALASRLLHPRQRLLFLGRTCWPTFQVLSAMLDSAELSAQSEQSKIENPGGGKSKMSLARCLFLDPPSPRERFWALAEALRCPAIGAVIADGTDLDPATSRRLQLAAEAGRGALALLARPPDAHAPSSWAATRWQVRPHSPLDPLNLDSSFVIRHSAFGTRGEAGPGNPPPRAASDSLATRMSWELTLTHCRHGGAATPRHWIFSWTYQVFRGTGALDLSPALGHSTAQTPLAQTA